MKEAKRSPIHLFGGLTFTYLVNGCEMHDVSKEGRLKSGQAVTLYNLVRYPWNIQTPFPTWRREIKL